MIKLRYKLTLEFEDGEGGQRSLSASSEDGSSEALSGSLAHDISLVLAILHDPPSAHEIVRAMHDWRSDEPLALLARLYEHWTAEENMGDCIKLAVDVDALCRGADDKRADDVRRLLRRSPWASEIKEQP